MAKLITQVKGTKSKTKACITEEENLITMINLGDSGVLMYGNLGLITLRIYHRKIAHCNHNRTKVTNVPFKVSFG